MSLLKRIHGNNDDKTPGAKRKIKKFNEPLTLDTYEKLRDHVAKGVLDALHPGELVTREKLDASLTKALENVAGYTTIPLDDEVRAKLAADIGLACFVCEPTPVDVSQERPYQWVKPRCACGTHKQHATLYHTGERVYSFLDRQQREGPPYEGSGIAFIVNPSLIENRRSWNSYLMGLAIYEGIFPRNPKKLHLYQNWARSALIGVVEYSLCLPSRNEVE